MSIRAIYFEEQNIGEHIKKSKKRFVWKFELDGLQHTIEFYVSKLTGKKKVVQDGITLLEQKKITKSFQFPFNIGKHMCVIMYSISEVDLRIDNHPFDTLYKGKQFGGPNVPSVYKKQEGMPRSNTAYLPQKKVPEGWAEVKKAKDDVKYDDIPDPYSLGGKKESSKEEHEDNHKSLKDLGRKQKSTTVVKKNQNANFFDDEGGDDDFGWDNQVRMGH